MEADFTQVADGVDLELKVEGLQPHSVHGLHIHENGDCRGPDFTSAGNHFNPQTKVHGPPDNSESHLGDLGNIKVDDKGSYAGVIKIKNATREGVNGIHNRSLIIHEQQDDLISQPAGNSGKRLACIIISDIKKQ